MAFPFCSSFAVKLGVYLDRLLLAVPRRTSERGDRLGRTSHAQGIIQPFELLAKSTPSAKRNNDEPDTVERFPS